MRRRGKGTESTNPDKPKTKSDGRREQNKSESISFTKREKKKENLVSDSFLKKIIDGLIEDGFEFDQVLVQVNR